MQTFRIWFHVLCGCLVLLALGLPVPASPADAPKPKATPGDSGPAPLSPEALAQRVWLLTSLVLEQDLDPPTRQEMVLTGAKALLKSGGTSVPQDLSRRISTLTTEEQFKALVKDLWSQVSNKANTSAAQLQAALFEGLLSGLPGDLRILPLEDTKIAEQIAGNRYVGIGVQIRKENNSEWTQIVTPLPHSPARRAGVKAGDLVLQVDGKSTEGLNLPEVVKLLRGEEGTSLTLVVRQPDSAETRTLKMTRGVIPFETVIGYRRLSEDDWQFRIDPTEPVAYLSVKSLTSSTLHDLRQLEQRLQAESCRALVLDLRFAGGGHLQHAALLAGGLLDGGLLWRVRDAQGQAKEFHADRDCLFRDWPMVVLVSELGTVSSSELIAMALQDNGRAVVVGERTKGTGYAKAAIPLPDGQGLLLLRTGRLERPKPTRDAWGVQPNHPVALTSELRAAVIEWQNLNQRPERPANAGDRVPQDPQLAKAIEVLRAALKTTGAPK